MNEKLVKVVEFLKTLKCKNVSTFDLSDEGGEKFFVIVSAISSTDTKKVADELCTLMKFDKDRLDGYHKGEWIILDDDPIIVHIFTSNERAKYNLDRLYKSKEIDVLKSIKKKKSK